MARLDVTVEIAQAVCDDLLKASLDADIAYTRQDTTEFIVEGPLDDSALSNFLQANASSVFALLGRSINHLVFVTQALIPCCDFTDCLVSRGVTVAPTRSEPVVFGGEEGYQLAICLPDGVSRHVIDDSPDALCCSRDVNRVIYYVTHACLV